MNSENLEIRAKRNTFEKVRNLFRGRDKNELIEGGILTAAFGIYGSALCLLLAVSPDQNRNGAAQEIFMAPKPPSAVRPTATIHPQENIVYERDYDPVPTPSLSKPKSS